MGDLRGLINQKVLEEMGFVRMPMRVVEKYKITISICPDNVTILYLRLMPDGLYVPYIQGVQTAVGIRYVDELVLLMEVTTGKLKPKEPAIYPLVKDIIRDLHKAIQVRRWDKRMEYLRKQREVEERNNGGYSGDSDPWLRREEPKQYKPYGYVADNLKMGLAIIMVAFGVYCAKLFVEWVWAHI